MPEYYVRLDGSDEALGPMTEEQLKLLAEEDKITPQTQHFFDDINGWQPIEENTKLSDLLWEKKRKLSLKTRSPIPDNSETKKTAPTKKAPIEELSVEKMLQSSQGKTKETAHITKENRWRNRTAGLALPFLTAIHLIMAGIMIAIRAEAFGEIIDNQTWMSLLTTPDLALSLAVLIVGAVLLLSVTAVYPIARYLAMVVMGFFFIDAWNHIHDGLAVGWGILTAGIGFGVGVFWSSSTLSFRQFCAAMVFALVGLAAYAWVFFA